MLISLLTLLTVTGCSDKAADTAAPFEGTDLRQEFPAPPEGGHQWLTPEYVIPAYTEKQFCYFDTYQGEDVGINFQGNYQVPYGHHVLLLATNADEDDFPDGTILDCTDRDVLPMTEIEPIVVGATFEDNVGELWLPEGMATKLKSGTRIVLQSHYVNTSAEDILVQDAVNYGYVAEDTVETWAAAFAHTTLDFEIPAGASSTIAIDCAFDEDVSVLFLAGHLHELGEAFSVDHVRGDQPERIYEITDWDPYYRDVPPVNEYAVGEYPILAGESFTTTCSWTNSTDHAVTFPEEMCATYGMAYPTKVPLICTPSPTVLE